jgi:hypothetical protein
MPIAKITGQGLAAIACSVGLLWTCVIAERIAKQNAVSERVRVIREVRQLREQQHTVPVSTPSVPLPLRLHVTEG